MTHTPTHRYEEPDATTNDAAEGGEAPRPNIMAQLHVQFREKILTMNVRLDEPTVLVEAGALTEVMTWLRTEGKFLLLSDLTAHDCHGKEPRFFVIYQLTNLETPQRLRVKVGLPEKTPAVDSVVPIWPGADFFEREVYDLFGITFTNHPNLKRIMMPDEWEGHPLRKDYPVVYEPIQFTHNAGEVAARKPFAQG